jgi:hypothetical protein
MKNFITNNWFRMVVGTSTLIFSVGFFIRSITPSYANNPNPNNTSNVASTNGYAEGNYIYFFDNGILYKIKKGDMNGFFLNAPNDFLWDDEEWVKEWCNSSGGGYLVRNGNDYVKKDEDLILSEIKKSKLYQDPITKVVRSIDVKRKRLK